MTPGNECYLIFLMGTARYAFPLEQVAEVGEVCELWPFPSSLPCFRGMMTYKGILVSAVDLAGFLGISVTAPPEKLLVMDTAASGIAFLVGSVVRIALPEPVSGTSGPEMTFSDGSAELLDFESIAAALGDILKHSGKTALPLTGK